MKASSVPTIGPVTALDSEELTTYTFFTNFNFFIFSRNTNDVPLFLLHRASESSNFAHFSGALTQHDPIAPFAAARDVVTKTRGLLNSQNLKYFLAEKPSSFQINDLVLEEDFSQPIRPQKGFSAAVDDICQQICETPFLFQNSQGNVTYFIEVPMLGLETLNEAAKESKVKFEGKYFTLQEILDTENQEVSPRLRRCFDDIKLHEYTERFIVDYDPIDITGHYAVISCDPTSTTSMLPVLHYSIFKKHGERWRFYKAYEGELPTEQDLKKIKGIIIPGSPHSAYDTKVSWYNGLFNFIRKVVNNHNHINLLCICFGAQAVAQALGGKVAKMGGNYIRGGETLKFNSSFYDLEFVKKIGLDYTKGLVIAESHGDHIVELPPGAVLQASSARTNVEIYTLGKNVLALQGHPEYNEIWTAGANYRIMKPNVEDYDVYAKEYIKTQFPNAVCQKELLSVCFRALKK